MKNENNKRNRSNVWAIIVIIIGLVLVIIAPVILTLDCEIFGYKFNFGNSSQIGDTIGGITAPIIGLLSAILVYIAFREQVKANKAITDRFKDEDDEKKYDRKLLTLEVYFNHYKDEISKFSHSGYNGVNGINKQTGTLYEKCVFYRQGEPNFQQRLAKNTYRELKRVLNFHLKIREDINSHLKGLDREIYSGLLENIANKIDGRRLEEITSLESEVDNEKATWDWLYNDIFNIIDKIKNTKL